jgi:hypothetical protein
MPNTKPRKWQFTHYPATKLFNNILPNTNNLNHDIQEFLRPQINTSVSDTVLEVPVMLNPIIFRRHPRCVAINMGVIKYALG